MATVVPPDQRAFQAALSQGGLVAAVQTAWVEMDGNRWMPADAAIMFDRAGITVWQGGLVSWDHGGAVRTSKDGSSWIDAVSGPGNASLETTVAFGDHLVLLGEGTLTTIGAWSSPDGSVWTPIKGAPLKMKAATTMQGGGLLAVGRAAPSATWTTLDATKWKPAGDLEPAGAGTDTLYGVAASDARSVAIGDTGEAAAAWSSDDLRKWTRSPNIWGKDSYLSGITVVRGTFVITGRRGMTPVVWLSPDGTVWSAFDLPIAVGVNAEAIETIVRDGKLVDFGYSTEDAHNGGWIRTGYLVWTSVLPV